MATATRGDQGGLRRPRRRPARTSMLMFVLVLSSIAAAAFLSVSLGNAIVP